MGISALAFHDRAAAADRSSAPEGALRRTPTSLDAIGQRPGPDDTEAAVLAADDTEVALARIAALPLAKQK